MRWVFRFLVEGERYFFFGAWLATSPVFATGFSALIQISLTDTALALTCKCEANFFPSTPACFRSPTNSTGKCIVELLVELCSLLTCIRWSSLDPNVFWCWILGRYIYIIVTDMKGNIKIYRLPKGRGTDQWKWYCRRREQYHFHWSVPQHKGSLSILIFHSISVTHTI